MTVSVLLAVTVVFITFFTSNNNLQVKKLNNFNHVFMKKGRKFLNILSQFLKVQIYLIVLFIKVLPSRNNVHICRFY